MTASNGERGAALVVTLVFVTAMAAAAVAFLDGRRSDALTLRGQLQAVEAQAMLDAALQQTVALIANRDPRQRIPPRLSWQFGDVQVQVRFENEAGKVDLNAAPNTMLRALPLALGLDEARAAAFADTVQDWRDDNQLKLDAGAEDRDYRSAGAAAGGAADRPFASPAELRYLPVVDPAVWSMVEPHVTVYSGAAEPDARLATGPVREAVKIARSLKADDPDPTEEQPAADDAADDQEEPGDAASSGFGRGGQGSFARRDRTDGRRDRTGGISDRGEDGDAATRGGADARSGGGSEGGVRSVVLDVRFPNGYEAAAKAVVALAEGGAGGPPYIVLDWTPILRTRGDAS